MANRFSGPSRPSDGSYRGVNSPTTTPPGGSPQSIPPECSNISYTPNIEFVPLINGQPFNQLIKLGRPVRQIYFRYDFGLVDIAAWIHWTKFPAIVKDVDTIEALGLPGIFVGQHPTWSIDVTVPADTTGYWGSLQRIPFIKLCRPVDNFLFTAWGESAGAVVDIQAQIFATDDFEEIWSPTQGGI